MEKIYQSGERWGTETRSLDFSYKSMEQYGMCLCKHHRTEFDLVYSI